MKRVVVFTTHALAFAVGLGFATAWFHNARKAPAVSTVRPHFSSSIDSGHSQIVETQPDREANTLDKGFREIPQQVTLRPPAAVEQLLDDSFGAAAVQEYCSQDIFRKNFPLYLDIGLSAAEAEIVASLEAAKQMIASDTLLGADASNEAVNSVNATVRKEIDEKIQKILGEDRFNQYTQAVAGNNTQDFAHQSVELLEKRLSLNDEFLTRSQRKAIREAYGYSGALSASDALSAIRNQRGPESLKKMNAILTKSQLAQYEKLLLSQESQILAILKHVPSN